MRRKIPMPQWNTYSNSSSETSSSEIISYRWVWVSSTTSTIDRWRPAIRTLWLTTRMSSRSRWIWSSRSRTSTQQWSCSPCHLTSKMTRSYSWNVRVLNAQHGTSQQPIPRTSSSRLKHLNCLHIYGIRGSGVVATSSNTSSYPITCTLGSSRWPILRLEESLWWWWYW